MKKLFIILTILAMAVPVMANSVHLDWSFPEDQIDNIDGYNIYMRLEGSEFGSSPEAVALPDEFSGDITNLPDGAYWFVITADYGMYESARSAEGGIIFSNGEVSYPLSMSVPTILTVTGQAD
jgi:hypothetical protein